MALLDNETPESVEAETTVPDNGGKSLSNFNQALKKKDLAPQSASEKPLEKSPLQSGGGKSLSNFNKSISNTNTVAQPKQEVDNIITQQKEISTPVITQNKNFEDARTFIENDFLSQQEKYKSNVASVSPFAPAGTVSIFKAPTSPFSSSIIDPNVKPVINTASLKKYTQDRAKELNDAIGNLEEELAKLRKDKPGAITILHAETVILKKIQDNQNLLSKVQGAATKVAEKVVPAEKFKGKDLSTMDASTLEDVGAEILGVAAAGDYNNEQKAIAGIGKIPINVEDKQNAIETQQKLKFKNFSKGAAAFSNYMLENVDQKYKIAEPKIQELSSLLSKKGTTTIDEQKRINEIIKDKDVEAYYSSISDLGKTSKNVGDVMDKNYPQVRRQQTRQKIMDAFGEVVMFKTAKDAYSINSPLNTLRFILGEYPTEDDVPLMSKLSGIPEAEIKDIMKDKYSGWWASSPESIRMPGALIRVAQSVDKMFGDIQSGGRRILNTKDADIKNKLLANKIENYDMMPEIAKLRTDAGKYQLNPYSIMGTIGDVSAQAAIFGAPNLIGEGLLSGVLGVEKLAAAADVAKTARIASNVNKISNAEEALASANKILKFVDFSLTTGTGAISSYESGYNEAAKYTSDESKRRAYATVSAFGNGLSENILSPAQMLKKIAGGNVGKVNFQSFEKAIAKEGSFVGTMKTIGLFAKELGTVVAEEDLEELVSNVVDTMGKQLILNKSTSIGEFADQAIETIVQTTIGTLGLGIGAGISSVSDRSRLKRESLFEAGMEPQRYIANYENLHKLGKIDEKTRDNNIQKINTMAKIVNNLPELNAKGDPLSFNDKVELAAQQFRISHNKSLMQSGAIDGLQELLKADSDEAANIQKKVIEGNYADWESNENDINHIATSVAKKTEEVIQNNPVTTAPSGEDKAAQAEADRYGSLKDDLLKALTPQEKEFVAERADEVQGSNNYDEAVKKVLADIGGEVIPSDVKTLISDYRKKSGITEDVIDNEKLLKDIAEQAQNISGGKLNTQDIDEKNLRKKTSTLYGKELVDAAIEKYPASSLIAKEKIKDSGLDSIDKKEIERQMAPVTEKMAEIEMQFENKGFNIDNDYDNEISVTDKDGEMVEPEELPEDLQKLAADYEKVTSRLGEYDEPSFKKSLDDARKKIRGEEIDFEEVDNEDSAEEKLRQTFYAELFKSPYATGQYGGKSSDTFYIRDIKKDKIVKEIKFTDFNKGKEEVYKWMDENGGTNIVEAYKNLHSDKNIFSPNNNQDGQSTTKKTERQRKELESTDKNGEESSGRNKQKLLSEKSSVRNAEQGRKEKDVLLTSKEKDSAPADNAGSTIDLPQDKKNAIISKLVGLRKQYNNTPANASNKISDIIRQINTSANKLGYTIKMGDKESGNKKRSLDIIDENGKSIRTPIVKFNTDLTGKKTLEERGQDFIHFVDSIKPTLMESLSPRNNFDSRMYIGLPADLIRSGIKAIEKGKYNENAFIVLDKLEEIFKDGYVPYEARAGRSVQRDYLPISYFTELPDNLNKVIDVMSGDDNFYVWGGLDPAEALYEIPSSWIFDFPEFVSDKIGDDWKPENFETEDFKQKYDEAFSEKAIDNIVDKIDELQPNNTVIDPLLQKVWDMLEGFAPIRDNDVKVGDKFFNPYTGERFSITKVSKSGVFNIRYDGRTYVNETKDEPTNFGNNRSMRENDYKEVMATGISDLDFKVIYAASTRMNSWHNNHLRDLSGFSEEEIMRYDELSDMFEPESSLSPSESIEVSRTKKNYVGDDQYLANLQTSLAQTNDEEYKGRLKEMINTLNGIIKINEDAKSKRSNKSKSNASNEDDISVSGTSKDGNITRASNSSSEQDKIKKGRLNWTERNEIVDKAFIAYPKKIDPDRVRDLLAPFGYNKSNASEFNWDMDYILDKLYEKVLEANRGSVMAFVIGAPGVGKSTVTNNVSKQQEYRAKQSNKPYSATEVNYIHPVEVMRNLGVLVPELSSLMAEATNVHEQLEKIDEQGGGGMFSGFKNEVVYPFPFRLYSLYVTSNVSTPEKKEKGLNEFTEELNIAKEYLKNKPTAEELSKRKSEKEKEENDKLAATKESIRQSAVKVAVLNRIKVEDADFIDSLNIGERNASVVANMLYDGATKEDIIKTQKVAEAFAKFDEDSISKIFFKVSNAMIKSDFDYDKMIKRVEKFTPDLLTSNKREGLLQELQNLKKETISVEFPELDVEALKSEEYNIPLKEIKDNSPVVWDGVFSSTEKLFNFVERALQAGLNPQVSLVYNNPETAYKNIIKRYFESTEKRIVPLQYFVNAVASQANRNEDLINRFGDKVKVSVYDNSSNNNQPILLDTDGIAELDWGFTDEQILRISNTIKDDNRFTDIERAAFLRGSIGQDGSGKAVEQIAAPGGNETNDIGSEGGIEKKPITEEGSGGLSSPRLTKSIEVEALEERVAAKAAELRTAEKKLTQKAKKLDNQIQSETRDLFGEKKATTPDNALFQSDIDVTKRNAATEKERTKVNRLREQLNSLQKQLETAQATPTAQQALDLSPAAPITNTGAEVAGPFEYPQPISLMDKTVMEINELYFNAQEILEAQVDPLRSQFEELKKAFTKTKNKNDKEIIKQELDSVSDKITDLQSAFNEEQANVIDVMMPYLKRRAQQEGFELNQSELEELNGSFFDAIFDRPGTEIYWNETLDSVISDLLRGFNENTDVVNSILYNPTLEIIADLTELPKEEFLNRWLYSTLNDFKNHDFKAMVDRSGYAMFSAGNNTYYSKPLGQILGIEFPWEARNKAEQAVVLKMLEDRWNEIYNNQNGLDNEKQQPNDGGTGGGISVGAQRSNSSESDQGTQQDVVSGVDEIGQADRGDSESGGGIQQRNAPTDGRAEGTQPVIGKGDRMAGNNSAIRTVNYKLPENYQAPTTFNKARRYEDNIQALTVLKKLSLEGRNATPEEQEILSKYVGFGGLKEIGLDPKVDAKWKPTDMKYRDQVEVIYDLIESLDPGGAKGYLQSVTSSILNAHYTPFSAIKGIYNILDKAGFTGGATLEPSAGIGNFISAMPESMSKGSQFTAIELDGLTGAILKQLQPLADTYVKGFQETSLPEGHYDLVISNVPYGQNGVYDPTFKSKKDKRYNTASQSIHNYFFAKALDLVRPGGVIAFITSRYTLDSTVNTEVRELLGDHAEFMGAIRMPDTTFKGNAGTAVVADVIFLRKYDVGEAKKENQQFIQAESKLIEGKNVIYNSYFQTNPEMMLGTIELGGQYTDDEFNLKGDPELNLEEAIAELGDKIFPMPIFTEQQKSKNARIKKESNEYVEKEEYDKIGNIVELPNGEAGVVLSDFYIDEALDQKAKDNGINPFNIRNGELTWYEEEKLQQTSGLTKEMFLKRQVKPLRIGKENKVKVPGIVRIRTLVNKLFYQELRDFPDTVVTITRTQLKTAYDNFVKDYGKLNTKDNITLLKHDTDQYMLLGLENRDKLTGKFTPADLFTKRTIKPIKQVDKVDNIQDALLVSLEEFGHVDIDRVASLLNKTPAEVMAEQKPDTATIFKQPDGTYEGREEYLSGNVKKKLAEARKAASENNEYNINVTELEKVQPANIPATGIYTPLNARWIPIVDITNFLADTFGNKNVRIKYSKSNDNYDVKVDGSTPESEAFKTKRKSFEWIAEHALNGIEPIVKYTVHEPGGKTSTLVDIEDTQLAKDSYKKLRQAWDDWKFKDATRRDNLVKLYNDAYNTTILRSYDGSHLQFPGLLGFVLEQHQVDAIWRFNQTQGGIADHIVGGGKTLIMIAHAMEMRRLGIAKKPLIAGLKSQVPQMYEEFKRAYPLAKVLFPSEKDFSKENRKQLLSTIATNDWDAVIVTHDQLTMIPLPIDVQVKIVQDLTDEIKAEIAEETDKNKLKGLETRLLNYEAKMDRLADSKKDSDIIGFDSLGVDYMMVDESQEFKNLEFITRKKNIRGLGSVLGSKKAFNMLVLCRYIQSIRGGDKGILFASGTPISNTMAEMYHLFKFLRPNKMAELGIKTFDQWASLFAEDFSELEYTMGRWKEICRFRKFVNLPELITLYREIADVRNEANLTLDRPKMEHILRKIDPTDSQLRYIEMLQEYASSKGNAYKNELGLTAGYDDKKGVNPSYGLLATNFAKKLSLDPRLIDKNAGEGSKLSAAADEMARIYNETTQYLGSQLVFCDTGTPKSKNVVENLYNYIEAENIFTDSELKDIFGEDFFDKKTKPQLSVVRDKIAEVMSMSYEDIDGLVQEASMTETFNVYNALKGLLMQRGIAAEEIGFIHDYEGRVKRKLFYAAVNSGKIRIAIGSTKKMGVGVNVQERAVAAHHLDIPWRPSDLEQRNGRVERKKNIIAKEYRDNKVQGYYYATERTFDGSMYNTVNIKQQFITQIKLGGTADREMADISSEFDAGNIAAELSGDPLFKEKATLEKRVQELRSLQHSFNGKKYEIEDNIRHAKIIIQAREADNVELRAAEKVLNENPKNKDEDFIFKATINGQNFDKVSDTGEAILKLTDLAEMKYPIGKEFSIGSMWGFKIMGRVEASDEVFSKPGAKIVFMKIISPAGYVIEDKVKPSSDAAVATAMRIKNPITNIPLKIDRFEKSIKLNKDNIPKYEEQLKEEFSGAEELKTKSARLDEVTNIMRDRAKAEEADKVKKYQDNTGEDSTTDFVEDSATQYGITSNGEAIPFKVIGGAEEPLPNFDRSGDNMGIGVERLFTQYKGIDFTGPTKITSNADVAWIFSALEDEAIENVFAVFVKEDGSYFVQHNSTGTVDRALIDPTSIVAIANKYGAAKVYLVHNHPSGNISASRPDVNMLRNLENALSGIADVEAIIINLKSGLYGMFDSVGVEDFFYQSKPDVEMFKIPVYSFNKQVFSEGYYPKKITMSSDIASFITTQRFSPAGKVGLLVLSQANNINAKILLPFNSITGNVNEIYKKIAESVSFHAGNIAILFGNTNENKEDVQLLRKRLSDADIKLLDYVQGKENNEYTSFADEGYMYDLEHKYGAAKDDFRQELRDSSSNEEKVRNNLLNLAFTGIEKGMTDTEFLADITKTFAGTPYGNARDVRLAYERAMRLMNDINSSLNDQAALNDIMSKVSFGPLLQSISFYIKNAPKPQFEEAPTEKEQAEAPKPVYDDFLKSYNLSSSDVIAQLQSGLRLEQLYEEIPEGANQDYFITRIQDMSNDGDQMIAMAREKFGNDVLEWVPPTLQLLESAQWPNLTKKVIVSARIVHVLQELKGTGNDSGAVRNLTARAWRFNQQMLHDAALSLNAAKLNKAWINNDYSDFYTSKLLDKYQARQKDNLENTEAQVQITDDVAEEGVPKSDADVAEAIEQAKPKEKEKKKKGDKETYAKKADEARKKLSTIDSIKELIKNLKC